MNKNRTFWLEDFKGAAKGGAYYRSNMAIDIDDFETKFKTSVVGIEISETSPEDIHFIVEINKEDKEKYSEQINKLSGEK